MLLSLLKCKLHGATVTDANLNYEGSIGIPRDLMDAAGLLANERVDVLNFNNGERFTTYVLEYPKGSGHIVINGPAAHKVKVGHKVIVCAYAHMEAKKAAKHVPTVVIIGANNRIKKTPDKGMLDPKRKTVKSAAKKGKK